MPPEFNSAEISPFYHWAGFAYDYLFRILLILSFLLLCIGKPRNEAYTRATSILCILCASVSTVVFYAYAIELFEAYTSAGKYELEALKFRLTDPNWWGYAHTFLGALIPVFLFFPVVRKSLWRVFIISVIACSAIHLEKILLSLL